jgi:hypothetical protein
MRPLQLTPLKREQIEELHTLYRTTKDVRVRTRTQMGSVAKLIITSCYPQLMVFFSLEHFNI